MLKQDKYLDVLKKADEPITILEWANRLVEAYPAILKQTNRQTNKPMTLQAFVTNLSLQVSKGEFPKIKVLDNKPYRKVMYLSEAKKNEVIKEEVHRDLLSVILDEKVALDTQKATEYDRYRLEELKSITEQLNKYFSLNFVLHHALSLKSEKNEARHHADNLQILTVEHSLLKKDAEKKFSIEEQKAYIKRVIVVHMMIDKSMDMSLTDEVLEMLLDRLDKVY
ncbi:MAG TPA: hypothetical protein ENK82_09630 [Campylobacterales bacterium]|nr:hypothetical protein [Campylobacterales bacterium]